MIIRGKWVRKAAIQDEEWLEGQVIDDPDKFISELKRKPKADIFTFAQNLPAIRPKYQYHMKWDNVAAIPISSYNDWWEKRLPQVTRKSVRRGYKRGVTARITEFGDELVHGIISIHKDTPIRQGVPFAYTGMDFETIKRGYGTYLDRSEFIGAYYGNELVGIVKIVYIGKIASIMQILSKTRHYDKRPTNILIAKAVEVCEKKGISFLVYGKYTYGNKTESSLTEFKRRTGFEKILLPRYYIPLTFRGKLAIKLKLHLGLLEILPGSVISFLRDLRSRYYQIKLRLLNLGGKLQSHNQKEGLIDMEGKDD